MRYCDRCSRRQGYRSKYVFALYTMFTVAIVIKSSCLSMPSKDHTSILKDFCGGIVSVRTLVDHV